MVFKICEGIIVVQSNISHRLVHFQVIAFVCGHSLLWIVDRYCRWWPDFALRVSLLLKRQFQPIFWLWSHVASILAALFRLIPASMIVQICIAVIEPGQRHLISHFHILNISIKTLRRLSAILRRWKPYLLVNCGLVCEMINIGGMRELLQI